MYSDISQEWREQCEHIKLMSEPLELQEFGLQRLERCLASEFKVVQYMTQTQKHLTKFYTNPGHFSFNRHAHIMTFDKNRAVLGPQADKEDPDNYINANLIQVNDHLCIATQAPLHSTILNFWRMVDEHRVAAIFMLCERVEKTKVKCDLYWPISPQESLKTGNYEVKLISLQEKKCMKTRKFELLNLQTKSVSQVTQYQILGWPDGDKPAQKMQKSMFKAHQIFLSLLQNSQMTVIHCSAGVGRTGTFIAMAAIKLMINSQVTKLSIFEIVRKLREQRWAMVYSAAQYEYLYDFTEAEANKCFQPTNQQANSEQEESD